MNYPNYSKNKDNPRKLYPNPSASHLTGQYSSSTAQMSKNINGMNHINKFSKHKHSQPAQESDQERVGSKSDVFNPNTPQGKNIYGINEQQGLGNEGDSRVSRVDIKKTNIINLIRQKEQHFIQLKQRLRNIHHFYRIRIEQQRQKNLQKNQIFIGVIQDLQRNHNSRIQSLQQQLESVQNQKQDVNYVDQRMESIKSNIQQILTQSKQLKQSNDQLQKLILQKQLIIKEKQEQSAELKQQIENLRNVLENFQRLKLKQNKRSKQLIEIIQTNINP